MMLTQPVWSESPGEFLCLGTSWTSCLLLHGAFPSPCRKLVSALRDTRASGELAS